MPPLPLGDKGPCRVIWNYGESGAIDLGDYLGQVLLKMDTNISPIEVEAQGDAMVDAIFTGAVMTLDVPLTRPALEALEAVLMGELKTEGGNQVLHIKNPAGCSLYDMAKRIVIKPLCNNIPDPDPANWMLLYKCHPVPAINLPFDRSTQRTFPVRFIVFVSQESGEEGEFGQMVMESGSTEYGL
jgi:hypothetical protein